MTFSEFLSTRVWCNDISEKIPDAKWEHEPATPKGYVYCGLLFIEEVQQHWPTLSRNQVRWHLMIGRQEWITDNLTFVERKLYEFAVDEGYTV